MEMEMEMKIEMNRAYLIKKEPNDVVSKRQAWQAAEAWQLRQSCYDAEPTLPFQSDFCAV